MNYLKKIGITTSIFTALSAVTACAVLKPVGDITLLDAPVRIPDGEANIAAVSVDAIVTGWVEAPAFILMDQDNTGTPEAYHEPQWVPSISYIVRHPSRGSVIIDFGLKSGTCSYGLKPIYWVPCQNEDHLNLAEYLREKSELLEDLIYLIPSHFHGDHISGLSEVLSLTAAPLLVTDASLREINSVKRAFNGIPSQMIKADMNAVSMNQSLTTDPLLGRYFDVFGDGSLKLFETPGHSNGHVSALAKTEKTSLLFSFDASHLRANYDLQIPSGSVKNKEQAIDSLKHLKQIASRLGDVEIIFGHEPDQWPCDETVVHLGGTADTSCSSQSLDP